MQFLITLICLGALILSMLYRVTIRSPNVFYKIQSINTTNSLCILFLIVYVYYINRPGFIDLGFIYLALNYVGTVVVLKYMETIYIYNHKPNKD